MEHNLHNSPLHWGYSAAPTVSQNQWAPPPQSRSGKRAMSESDCDELYSEESSKEQISPGESGSCQLMSRKKRRGVIEKKRRDRINSSLSELKRLVPSAYEKQGSAKLEKAEILQLTVEHLKNLHSKGIDTLSYDPQRFAMDYHIIGFRECAAEVARYLVTIEGMDIQDPLRLRLMSHLQYFVQQREISAKTCSSGSWTTQAPVPPFQSNCSVSPYPPYSNPPTHTNASSYVPNITAPIQTYPTLNSPPTTNTLHQQQQSTSAHGTRSNTGSLSGSGEALPLMNLSSTQQAQPTQQIQSQSQSQQLPQQTPTQTSHEGHHQQQHFPDQPHQEHQGSTYIELTSSQAHASHRNSATSSTNVLSYGSSTEYPVSVAQVFSPNNALNYVPPNGSKPYRPWGAEMAY